MENTLLVTKEDGILTIKFNNPKTKNSLNFAPYFWGPLILKEIVFHRGKVNYYFRKKRLCDLFVRIYSLLRINNKIIFS